jgi:hypothetical protein
MSTNGSVDTAPASFMSASPAMSPAAADAMATKPPARVEGLLQFVADLPRKQFSMEEQTRMANCPAGLQIRQAIQKCGGMSMKLREAEAQWRRLAPSERLRQKHQVEEARTKYLDCLSYAACPAEWKQYTQCWIFHHHQQQQAVRLRSGAESGELHVVPCQEDKATVERCVGKLVMSTVRAADETEEETVSSGCMLDIPASIGSLLE